MDKILIVKQVISWGMWCSKQMYELILGHLFHNESPWKKVFSGRIASLDIHWSCNTLVWSQCQNGFKAQPSSYYIIRLKHKWVINLNLHFQWILPYHTKHIWYTQTALTLWGCQCVNQLSTLTTHSSVLKTWVKVMSWVITLIVTYMPFCKSHFFSNGGYLI